MLKNSKDDIVNIHPAYNSVMVSLSRTAKLNQMCSYLNDTLTHIDNKIDYIRKTIDIPVLYGTEYGPDLERIAIHSAMSVSEVIKRHSGAIYTVSFIGFSIGFPYCSGMDNSISTPRLETPRKLVDAGSVAIAGNQTGIYPLSSPGGWNLIGKTTIPIFDKNEPENSYLQMGDQIRFIPINDESKGILL